MSELHDILWSVCQKLPSDFEPYGERNRTRAESGADCSSGCIHFRPLAGEVGMDWGVCANPKSPRAGLLTFEHQGCPAFTALDAAPQEDAEDAEDEKEKKGPVEEPEELAEDVAPLRKLKIVEYELTDALENAQTIDGETVRTYLDSETGEIVQLLSEWDDYQEICDRIDEEPARYYEIEPLVSHQSFQIMEDFAESLPASSWKPRLIDALSRNKPFRRFRDAVHADLKLRDQWFAFQREALKEYARNWLKSLGIEPQFVREVGTE